MCVCVYICIHIYIIHTQAHTRTLIWVAKVWRSSSREQDSRIKSLLPSSLV